MVTRVVARGLGFAYPNGVEALAGVELEAAAGELVCVLGPNGAGKSTLLKLLAGLLAPRDGTVELEGVPLETLTPNQRARRIALVPQSLRALPDLTVADFVQHGRYAHGGWLARSSPGDRAAVQRALAQADLAELSARPLAELSAGQRQRALVARALAQEAALLLIDEPTSALDPEHQVAVFELIARLTGEGRCGVVVTHDLNLASQFATRLVLLDAGRKVADGGPEEVLVREVLEPVYGSDLLYLDVADGDGAGRTIVVPWRGK